MVFSLIILFCYLILGLFICLKSKFFRLHGLPFFTSAVLLLLKFAVGLFLAWLYSDYYHDRSTADVFKFFDDSAIMYNAIYEKPIDYLKMLTGFDSQSVYFDTYYLKMNYWFQPYNLDYGTFNDTRTIIRLNAFFRIFSFGYYPVHVFFWCFMSLSGAVLLFKSFARFFLNEPYPLAFAVFLIPSVLLWSSGILKEGVVMLLLGLVFMSLFNLLDKKKVFVNSLFLVFALLAFIYVKVYILLALLPALASWLIVHFRNYKRVFTTFAFVHLLCFGFVLNIHFVFPSINFLEIISMKQQAILRLAWYNDSGSRLNVNPLDPNLFSLLRNLPEALFTALFRPLLWDWKGVLQWFSALENFLLMILFITTFAHKEKVIQPKVLSFTLLCFSFSFILFSVMGLTTPVLGALVRYRMPALPFLVIGLLLLIDKNKFNSTWQTIKKYV